MERIVKNASKEPLPSIITQSLAKATVLGIEVMRRCTKLLFEMFYLKRPVFQSFPIFWHSATAFEVKWKTKCWPAIEQFCCHLHKTATM